MKLLYNIGSELKGKWNVSFAMYECPYCSAAFKANVSDVKRNRVRHCGCTHLGTAHSLPVEINGWKVVADLGIINTRRTATFQCPHCPNIIKEVVSEMITGRHRLKHCGCQYKSRQPKKPKAARAAKDSVTKQPDYSRRKHNEATERLLPVYVRKRLIRSGVPPAQITAELIELKRLQLTGYRRVKSINQHINEDTGNR